MSLRTTPKTLLASTSGTRTPTRIIRRSHTSSTTTATATPNSISSIRIHTADTNTPGALTAAAAAAATTASAARFSPGADPVATAARLQPLLLPAGGRWALTPTGEGLERAFKFKTFAKTWDFMTAVSLRCKVHNHHPEWSNAYNTTFIRWTTHSPKGLSALDVDLAAACDALARDFGELDPEPAPAPEPAPESANATATASPSCVLHDLATRAAGSGECCAPKNKKP
ncbi:Pterin-4-alpha-carbinolamine dehydratase [Escovopsis weberi]|uniref:4a-hydroxytetrahydrobiopterin dehydratase n=1 Tax=Escovopsis weberi TaxID=150374 RepID=A0A0M8MZV1_ESCWE|nr:Pterin-4-alpha-carbinolamine dehydratase [Escovopsis weberi]